MKSFIVVRSSHAHLFSNPQVQRKALNLGFLQYFLRLLNTETNDVIILRLLFTLSTLLRNYPQSQQNFLEHGGAELMVKLLDQPNLSNKVVVRIVTLMNDLIIEKVRLFFASFIDR